MTAQEDVPDLMHLAEGVYAFPGELAGHLRAGGGR